MLRLWQQYEDQITAFLASEAGGQATPALRLYAMQLVAIVRSMTSPELRAAATGLNPKDTIAVSEQWLRTAARKIGQTP